MVSNTLRGIRHRELYIIDSIKANRPNWSCSLISLIPGFSLILRNCGVFPPILLAEGKGSFAIMSMAAEKIFYASTARLL
jgi:hypothetical protein